MNTMKYFALSILITVLLILFGETQLNAMSPFENPPQGGLPQCVEELNMCTSDLDTCDDDLGTCEDDLEECQAQPAQSIPGDGYENPDDEGLSGHGPMLSYTENGDGTFTDNNSGLMWEMKLAADNSDGGDCQMAFQSDRSVHCVNNVYTWTDTGDADNTNPDGTLFTEFINTLNNTCQNDESMNCSTDADCAAVGGECGFAGYTDWCIPNLKILQSIVDFSVINPGSTVPGSTSTSFPAPYWSSTSDAGVPSFVWNVNFERGFVNNANKDFAAGFFARAVRPCE